MLVNISQADIVEIKKAVRAALPAISSAHTSEAIAAGLGYKTSRSMRAAFDASEDGWLLRELTDEGFVTRLLAISGVQAKGKPLTDAVVRAASDTLEVTTHDIARLFASWKSNYEVADSCGHAQWIYVETEVSMYGPDLLDRLQSGEEGDLEGNIEWWANWGKRRHDAEVEIAEAAARGVHPVLAEADFVDPAASFEDDVLTHERIVRELKTAVA